MIFFYDDKSQIGEFSRLRKGQAMVTIQVPGDFETLTALYDLIMVHSELQADEAVENFRLAVEGFMQEELQR